MSIVIRLKEKIWVGFHCIVEISARAVFKSIYNLSSSVELLPIFFWCRCLKSI